MNRKTRILIALVLLGIVAWLIIDRASVESARSGAAKAGASATGANGTAGADATKPAADGSRIISVAPEPGVAPPAGAGAAVATTRDAAWLGIQQATGLRARVAQAIQSNQPEEAMAAMNALYYCNTVASRSAVTPAEAASIDMQAFPAQAAQLRRSSVERRGDEIEMARKRCAWNEDGPGRVPDAEMRRELAARLEPVDSLVRRLRGAESFDWSALSAEDRALLASGRVDVLSRVLGGLGDRWGALEEPRIENDIAAQLARHMAACRIGDACGADSFRFGEICVTLGACEGNDVQQALDALVNDEAMRQRMQRLSSRIVSQLTAPPPPKKTP